MTDGAGGTPQTHISRGAMEDGMATRTRCGGCGRKMAQLAPANRDADGRSWHYECLSNACGSMRDHYLTLWARNKARRS